MLTAVSVSLAGAVFGGRIAYQLTDADAEHRYAAIVAAVFARRRVLGIQDYFHYVMSVQSDPMLVTVCLAAIDCFLQPPLRVGVVARRAGRARPAGGVAVRRPVRDLVWSQDPEAALDAVRGRAGQRVPVVRRPDDHQRPARTSPASSRSSHRASCTTNKIVGTWDRFTALQVPADLDLAALIAVVLAALRRNCIVS